MKHKEKQIEEMAKDIEDNFINKCLCGEWYEDDYKELAERLIDINYQKLPENSIVLSKAKYEMLIACSSYEGVMSKLKDEYIRGSKETAEKILLPLLSIMALNIDTLKELENMICLSAKQFGVEIREKENER